MDIFLPFHGCTVYMLASPSQCSLQGIGSGDWQLPAGHGLTRKVGQQKKKERINTFFPANSGLIRRLVPHGRAS